jgi:hypothetical protein
MYELIALGLLFVGILLTATVVDKLKRRKK